MTWLPATRIEKLVGSFTADVRQAPNDTAHCVRAIFNGFGLLFGWIRFHIDLNSLPIPAFREVDCSAFANNLASSDIPPPPINARVKTTSVYRIASCGSWSARGC